MTTLTLAQLSADLLRIQAHGLTETNVTEVQHTAGGGVYFATDTSQLEADLAEAKESEARFEAELKDADTENEKLSAENEKLAEMHQEFADKESGITPATYRQNAEDADRSRDVYRNAMNEAREERDALRKRKGVTAALFRHERDLLGLLGSIANGTMEFTQAKENAKKLIVALHTP